MKKIISNKEAVEKYSLKDYDPFGRMEFSAVLLFEGDLHIKGDLDYAWFTSQIKELGENNYGYSLILIDGNLKVDGIIAPAEGSLPFLFVKGNVSCDVLHSFDEVIYIDGDANIKYAIQGDYNDGSLEIKGTTYVPYVLNSNHHTKINLTKDTITINYYGDDDDFFEYDFTVKDFDKAFVPGLVDKEGNFDPYQFIQKLAEGKSPFKKGAKTNRQIIQDQLDKIFKKTAPEKVVRLDLSDKKLKAFPKEILNLPNLKVLSLSINMINKIPGEIGQLKNLEELYLAECGLSGLPDEIGQLQNLKILDLSRNVQRNPNNYYDTTGMTLPEGIGNLANLKVLKINYNTGFTLPKSFGNLKSLEVLEAYQCSDGTPIDFPEAILKLTNLINLQIGSNSFKTIPDNFPDLENLEQLNLNASLCYLNKIPDLSGLKKLKLLHANGLISYTDRPRPKQSLLKSFFNLTSLEALYIDRHGESVDTYSESQFNKILKNLENDPERMEEFKIKVSLKEVNPYRGKIFEGVVRERLKPEFLEGIGNLVNLKELDISFNGLESLPEELYSLKNLEHINVGNNDKLSLEEIKRLYETFPNSKIISKKIRTRIDIDDENYRKVNSFIKTGAIAMHNKKYEPAIENFKAALQLCAPDKKYHEYDELYAHYGIVYSLSHQIINAEDSDRKNMAEEILKYGETALRELIPADRFIWHYTEEGAFQEECIRYIGNSIAWLAYTESNDSVEIEKALGYIERATKYVDNSHDYIHDTYVRLLIKAGKSEEAFAIVHKVLYRNPDFEDFKDFKKNKDYQKWAKSLLS